MTEDMTPGRLREIADWLDTLDRACQVLLSLMPLGQRDSVWDKAMNTVKGKEIQDDLRRWADEMESSGNS